MKHFAALSEISVLVLFFARSRAITKLIILSATLSARAFIHVVRCGKSEWILNRIEEITHFSARLFFFSTRERGKDKNSVSIVSKTKAKSELLMCIYDFSSTFEKRLFLMTFSTSGEWNARAKSLLTLMRLLFLTEISGVSLSREEIICISFSLFLFLLFYFKKKKSTRRFTQRQ